MTGQNLMNITIIRDSKLSSKESDLEEVILSIYLHHCSLLSVLIQLIGCTILGLLYVERDSDSFLQIFYNMFCAYKHDKCGSLVPHFPY